MLSTYPPFGCSMFGSSLPPLGSPRSLVGWSRDYRNEGFGDQNTIKMRLINLISSVRTLLRGEMSHRSGSRGVCVDRRELDDARLAAYLSTTLCGIT